MSLNFKKQLQDLGINAGDVVLMHSSMRALKTNRMPEEVIEDVISCIGPEGTLLIPALTYSNVDVVNPYFNVKETEPCIGLIPCIFLRMPGVVRSLHPTHSVCAYGKKANELTMLHILDETPVGPYSPLRKMLEYKGKILFIGEILSACTFMHGIEEIANVPYVLEKKQTHYFLEDENGTVIEKNMYAHDFAGYKQEYQRIKDILTFPDIKTGKVGEADSYLIDASVLMKKALEKLENDPFYFVSVVK